MTTPRGDARHSTAARVAQTLRTWIAEGELPPGRQLSEDSLATTLAVSRNTLREAFRQLTHERLLVHEFNRGVFVRVLSAGDVEDLFYVRRLIECAVVRELGPPPYGLTGLATAVTAGEQAAAAGDWTAVASANIHFHRSLVALAGSPRTDEIMSRLLAELRLALHTAVTPRTLYEPFVPRNRALHDALEAGDRHQSADLLAAYLDDSQAALTKANAEAGVP
ncbi:GntR family transcriptional regulator [Streptomyces sp. NPDC005774]|uniref:GntR family transcriptional regulator n=1 Tax=Streptomyces sp. NPDC005774 TaxID=3364728 RepID=UPI0036AAE534